jgi:hypothetical protein
MCIHTHMYTHINRHMYSHMHIHMSRHVHSHMCAYARFMHTCHVSHLIHMYTHMHIHMSRHVHSHMCTYARSMHTCAHMPCQSSYTHVYTHAYTYVQTCTLSHVRICTLYAHMRTHAMSVILYTCIHTCIYICPDMYTLTCAHMHALCTHAHTCHVSHLIDMVIIWLYWYHVISFVLLFSSVPYLTLKFLFSLPEELSPLFSYWSLTTINKPQCAHLRCLCSASLSFLWRWHPRLLFSFTLLKSAGSFLPLSSTIAPDNSLSIIFVYSFLFI